MIDDPSKMNKSPYTVLTIGSGTSVSRSLSQRLGRLGIRERVIQDQHGQSSNKIDSINTHKDYFLGNLLDPQTIIFASQDVDGIIIDMAGIPSALYSVQVDDQEHSIDTLGSRWNWKGPQADLSRIFKQALGTYKPPMPSPQKHSQWRPKSNKGSVGLETPTQSALSVALLSNLADKSLTRSLTFLIPSVIMNNQMSSLFSDEMLAAYQLSGWSPNLIFYDWVIDCLAEQPRYMSEVIPGDLSQALLGILKLLIQLKVKHKAQFKALVEGQKSLENLHQQLSLISTNDLVSAAILIHKLKQGGERYLLRGDQLTWSSLTQLCAHYVDGFSTIDSDHLLKNLVAKQPGITPYSSVLHRVLKRLQTDGAFFEYRSSPFKELNSTITSLIAKSYGGANLSRAKDYFAPLPHDFTWTSVLSLLETEIKALLVSI